MGPKTEHKHPNTQFVKTVDNSTNTDPLIVLDPVDIRSLHGGLHIATYNPEHRIYMTTNNSLSIMPVPKTTTKNQCQNSSTQIEGQPIQQSQTQVDQKSNQVTNYQPKNLHQPLVPHTSGNNMTKNTTNKTTTQYKPEQLKVKKESNGTAKPLVICYKLS